MNDLGSDLRDAMLPGRIGVDDLVATLQASGHPLGSELGRDPREHLREMLYNSRFDVVDDETVIDLTVLLDRIVFTVDFGERVEINDHPIGMKVPFMLAQLELPLAVAGEHTGRTTDVGSRFHERDWQSRREPGHLTAFQVIDGVFDVTPRYHRRPRLSNAPKLLVIFERIAAEIHDTQTPIEFDHLVLSLLASDGSSALDRVIPPLRDFMTEFELEHQNGCLVPAGFDWDDWLMNYGEENEYDWNGPLSDGVAEA